MIKMLGIKYVQVLTALYTRTLESFLILPRVYFRNNLFQLSLCFTLREVTHVIILWSHPAIIEN